MKKIVVLGPESVGKTTLCEALHKKFSSVLLPEYARGYVEKKSGIYDYSDIENIAKYQITEFKKAVAQAEQEFLILDTFLIVTKVWFMHVYGRYPKWLQSELEKSQIDLFLLLKPDLPWVEDPVRENPHLRQYLYDWYKREIEAIGGNYVEIEGTGDIRYKRAFRAVNALRKSDTIIDLK